VSDHCFSLIDVAASPAEAKKLGPRVVECLVGQRLIEPKLSEERVLGGLGYPPGPACAKAYSAGRSRKFWELVTSGVEVHSERWVNTSGFTVFETAECPRCAHLSGEEYLDEVGASVEAFYESGKVPKIACGECGAKSRLLDWKCKPALGFVNLAVVFWNWPSFDAKGWKLDIPALLSKTIGRPLVPTYGHV